MKRTDQISRSKERSSRRLLQQAFGLTLAVLLLTGCGGAPAEPTTAPTPVPPTAEPTPTSTPSPTPTLLPTSTPIPEVRGSLIDAETDEPLGDARIILCLQDSESSCCMDSDLSTVTDENGEFAIQVPGPGDYVVFYNVSGDMRPGWESLCLDYAKPFMDNTILSPSLQDGLRPMWESLGKGNLSICLQVWAGEKGWSTNAYSEEQDLGFVWMWDKPVAVTVTNGVGEINLAVWNVATESCGDEFHPIRSRAAPLPPADTLTPLPITIRVRMDNNPNGEINIEVLEGEYQLKHGTTLRAGSNIWEEEQYLAFPAGLAIEVGPAGLTLKGKNYPEGTLLHAEKEDQLMIVGKADPKADQDTPSPVVEELECQFDDGTQRYFYSIESPFISHTVQVDGEISSADEWSDALCVDLRLHEGNDYDSPNVHQARWWVQNDGQFAYFLARVPKNLPLRGVAVDYFWPRYTGTWAHSDAVFVNIEGDSSDLANWDEVDFYEDVELTPPGTIDVEAAVSEDRDFYWFEIKKDLNSGDRYDWAVKPGQIIGNNPSDSLLFALILEGRFFTRNIQMRLDEP